MHQPLTIAKVRKDTTLKVEAGSWIILVQPDEPFSSHAQKRAEFAAKGLVNEDFEVVAVGRMDNKYSDLKLVTAKEKKAIEAEAKASNETLAKASAEAEERQAKMDANSAAQKQAEHEAAVAKLNVMHDATRNKS